MLQIVQHQKTGNILVEDMPAPICLKEGVLVRTAFSLISAGTEKISVSNAQSSLLARAKKQPEQVKTVIDNIKKDGLLATIEKVKNKLDSYKSLGYSLSGTVIESSCDEFAPGDRVACAGAGYAVHGEIVTVPKNLCVKIPDTVSFEEAAYTTVGSIAMQGVRQADLRLGEKVAVIGLGLIGQITVQILKASGCKVIGIDLNEKLFERATQNGCDAVFPSSFDYVKNIIALCDGYGCDAVIITASTGSNEPLELALKIARKKGRIIVVGAVGMNVPRSPFYEKELSLKISCSYGPGRYDSNYEINGHDYPLPYVRWTENRNMFSFVELINDKKMDVKSMTTHVIKAQEAAHAYDIITGRVSEPFLGILLEYPHSNEKLDRFVSLKPVSTAADKLRIAFIGAGAFAQGYLLPHIKNSDAELTIVSNSSAANSQSAAKTFGFNVASTDAVASINHSNVNCVFVATRHDSHGKYVKAALEAGKPVFVEKPLAVNYDELSEIDEAVIRNKGRIMVGYNRRFCSPFKEMKQFFAQRSNPLSMAYRINAGSIPKDHWVYLEEQGGGRVVGELCHFIDCMVFLTGAVPIKVYAEAISSNNREVFHNDTVVTTIKFSDGSIGAIQYWSNGDSSVSKEYLEVFCENSSAIMDNFTSLSLTRNGKTKKITFDGKKGHKEEMAEVLEAMKKGRVFPISYQELHSVTAATFAMLQSLSTGASQEVK